MTLTFQRTLKMLLELEKEFEGIVSEEWRENLSTKLQFSEKQNEYFFFIPSLDSPLTIGRFSKIFRIGATFSLIYSI